MKKVLIICLIFTFQSLLAKQKIIAKIPEASGIVYSKTSNSLFVVNDEGSIYEINKKGKILREKKLGNYDFEGISIDEKKALLLLAIEGKDDILILEQNSLKIKKQISIKREYKGLKLLKKGSDGIEGLTFYKNKIYASNQSKKKYPKEDSSVIVVLDYDLNKKRLKIQDIIDPKITDISGLSFFEDKLFLISDKNNLLIKYDIQNKKILEKIKLSKKFAQEGLTFDDKGKLYIADDKGQVIKYKKWKN